MSKRDVKLGQTKLENFVNIDDNFAELFGNDETLETNIQGLSDRIDAVQGNFDGLSDEVDLLQSEVRDIANDLDTKQDALSTDQLNAVNSGITSAKVSTYDGVVSDVSSLQTDLRQVVVDVEDLQEDVMELDNNKLNVNPDGTTPLLDSNNKINTTYIPDSVLGQLEYKGTWNASTGTPSTPTTTFEKGWYYICTVAGNLSPNGTIQGPENPPFYEIGDWAVYNGNSFDKVDNTDAVRTVNGQIGDIETYKGNYSSGNYFKGDIVTQNSVLYLCIANADSSQTPSDVSHWAKMGKPREISYSFTTNTWQDLTVNGKTYKAIDLTSTPMRVVKTIDSGLEVEADVAYVRISTTENNVTTTTMYMISATGFNGSYTLLE